MFNQVVEECDWPNGEVKKTAKVYWLGRKGVIKVLCPPLTQNWPWNCCKTAKQQIRESSLFTCIIQKRNKNIGFHKPSDASGFRKFYSLVLKCDILSKSIGWNNVGTPKHS